MYLYNARIYTLDPQNPLGNALAILGERIIAVGSDQQIISEFAGKGPGLDMQGQTILPGLTDAHIHLQNYALSLQRVDCETSDPPRVSAASP